MTKQQQLFDPLAMWRDMAAKWQSSSRELVSTSMGPADFIGLIGHFIALSLRTQQVMIEVMARRVPPAMRGDLSELGERMRTIEERLDRLTPNEAPRLSKGKTRKPSVGRNSQPQQAAAASASKPARRTKKRSRSS